MTRPLLIFMFFLYSASVFSQGPKNQILIVEVLQGIVPEPDSSVTLLDSLSGFDSTQSQQNYMTQVDVLITLRDTTLSADHFNLIFHNGPHTFSTISKSFNDNSLPVAKRTRSGEVYIRLPLGAMTLPPGQKRLEVQLLDPSNSILTSKSRHF